MNIVALQDRQPPVPKVKPLPLHEKVMMYFLFAKTDVEVRVQQRYEYGQIKKFLGIEEEKPVYDTHVCVRLFIDVAEKMGRTAGLYHYLRYLDTNGSGRAEIYLPLVAQYFKKSERTIEAWIKEGKDKGWFYTHKRKDGVISIRYASIAKVAAMFKLERIGHVGFVTLQHLAAIRLAITEVLAASLQKQSEYAAKKDLSKRDKKRVVTERIVWNPSESCVGGNRSKRHSRFFFVTAETIKSGCTQEGIGEILDRHRTTINRRLSKRVRKRKELKPLARRQVLYEVGDLTVQNFELLRYDLPSEFNPIIVADGKCYEVGPNIYKFDNIENISYRFRKRNYKTRLETGSLVLGLKPSEQNTHKLTSEWPDDSNNKKATQEQNLNSVEVDNQSTKTEVEVNLASKSLESRAGTILASDYSELAWSGAAAAGNV